MNSEMVLTEEDELLLKLELDEDQLEKILRFYSDFDHESELFIRSDGEMVIFVRRIKDGL